MESELAEHQLPSRILKSPQHEISYHLNQQFYSLIGTSHDQLIAMSEGEKKRKKKSQGCFMRSIILLNDVHNTVMRILAKMMRGLSILILVITQQKTQTIIVLWHRDRGI